METTYLSQQLSCPNYKIKEEEGDFWSYDMKQGAKKQNIQTVTPIILFVLNGQLTLSYNQFVECRLDTNQFHFIGSTTNLDIEALSDTTVICCRFDIRIRFCEYFRLEALLPYYKNQEEKFYSLTTNKWIQVYLEQIAEYLRGSFLCFCLNKIKQQELFFLLRVFYNKNELAALFSPVLNEDMQFKASILRKWNTVKNVEGLAGAMNYSISGFKKKFEKSFGKSPFLWIQQKRSEAILKEITDNRLSNKEIIDLYQFSSEARFFEFCKKQYGKTPGNIRKEKKYYDFFDNFQEKSTTP